MSFHHKRLCNGSSGSFLLIAQSACCPLAEATMLPFYRPFLLENDRM